MDAPLQSILVPIVDDGFTSTLAYAEMLSRAFAKPVSLLFFEATLFKNNTFSYYAELSLKPFSEGVQLAVVAQDCVMVVWPVLRRRRQIQQCLNASRQWRIPYFFIPRGIDVVPIKSLFLPLSFLIEDREKGVWAKSISRVFDVEIIIVVPKDKGSRADENARRVAAFLSKNQLSYSTFPVSKSSFKLDREIVSRSKRSSDLVIITASRDYGLDDYLLGPKELSLISKSRVPLMLLNPRGDLYVLCGD